MARNPGRESRVRRPGNREWDGRAGLVGSRQPLYVVTDFPFYGFLRRGVRFSNGPRGRTSSQMRATTSLQQLPRSRRHPSQRSGSGAMRRCQSAAIPVYWLRNPGYVESFRLPSGLGIFFEKWDYVESFRLRFLDFRIFFRKKYEKSKKKKVFWTPGTKIRFIFFFDFFIWPVFPM